MYCINKENEMNTAAKMGLLFLLVTFCFGLLIGLIIPQDRECTVTIKDFQGVQHVIKGLADND